MAENTPLYLIANKEGKDLTDLLFWYEFQLGRFILAVLEHQPEKWGYLMCLIDPESGAIFDLRILPQTVSAQLAKEEDIDPRVLETIKIIKSNKVIKD